MVNGNLMMYIFGISICEALAQTCVKYYNMSHKLYVFLFALLMYCCVTYLLYLSYDYKGVGIVNVLWSGMTILVMLAVGIFVFNEEIHLHDWIGIFMIVMGMIIINVNNKH